MKPKIQYLSKARFEDYKEDLKHNKKQKHLVLASIIGLITVLGLFILDNIYFLFDNTEGSISEIIGVIILILLIIFFMCYAITSACEIREIN